MDRILDWIKGIVIVFVVLSALMYLVPKKQYKKYIQFFMEMVIVIAVISPLSKIVYANEDFTEMIQYTQFWQEMENLQKDTDKMEFMNEDYYKEGYEKSIAEDVRQMVEARDYKVKDIHVTLNNKYELEAVSLQVEKKGKKDDALIDKVVIGNGNNSYGVLSAEDVQLKKEMCEYYKLTEEQITITYTK